MKYKVIDAAWIADKSLDIYCSSVMKIGDDAKRRQSCTLSASSSIFNSVLIDMIKSYESRFDRFFIVAPCFPLMRFKKTSPVITRFICSNVSFLRENGVSASQFLDFFEKFIQLKWSDGVVTIESILGKDVVFLKSKYILKKEWDCALTEEFGSSLLDFNKDDSIFSSNPNIIFTMEKDLTVFSELNELEKYSLRRAVTNLH